MWLYLSSSVFMGWSLGANDAANVFGTAVSAQVIRWLKAAVLSAVFILAGAMLEGTKGIQTLGSLASQDTFQAFITMLAAALCVALMTTLKLPVSTSQAVVGAMIGVGLVIGEPIRWGVLRKIVICWLGTPVGAAVLAFGLYYVFSFALGRMHLNLFTYDTFVRRCLIIFGVYGAYSLGANNVANVTGVFYQTGTISMRTACLLGGCSMALGVLTFSKNVMLTVGQGVVPLEGFGALVTVVASAVTVHVYAWVGVPVSSSQAIVGAVIGVAFVKSVRLIDRRMLGRIFFGWVTTPVLTAVFAAGLMLVCRAGFGI
ncbi:MAG: hypothetical protein A3K19_30735 [Lentisphaerae bacterium RIFOXYB12_FULL_65_16]|nr:MAG: hypothetical protein A3K18_04160 [Lentisphaerae bacterium RIFOXYA12_64_32]OGV88795.1 MAG: hypothetical protein A3K19_30735 [Lentisphaerae bacterium RIFOXYB12_FULL_65_16]